MATNNKPAKVADTANSDTVSDTDKEQYHQIVGKETGKAAYVTDSDLAVMQKYGIGSSRIHKRNVEFEDQKKGQQIEGGLVNNDSQE